MSGRLGTNLPGEAYAAALAGLDAITIARLRKLLARYAPDEAWHLVTTPGRQRALLADHLHSAETAARLAAAAARVDPAALWQRCVHLGVAVHVLGQPGYPQQLASDRAAPAVLFSLGDLDHLAGRRAAIVGTRNATLTGRDIAERFGAELAAQGVRVVSGLAAGIDAAAHRGALSARAAPPIGVVGSGLDTVYPANQGVLWRRVATEGLLLSEVPPGTPPQGFRFPLRNRILAALAEVVLVVESRASGGSMLTVDQAARRGVPVLAVPGSLRNRAAEGTNRLISDGCQPATDATDVLVALGLERSGQMRFPAAVRARPAAADRVLLDLLGSDAEQIDELVRLSDLTLVEVALGLGRLEADGWVVRTGSWFEKAVEGVSTSP